MSYRTSVWMVVVATWIPAFASACGGAKTEAAPPSNPPAEAPSEAPATAAPEAGASSGAPTTAPSAEAAPTSSAAAAPAPEPSGPPGPGDWDKWSHEQKLAYMKSAVMPKMGTLFHDFNSKTFAEPKCVLCHGDGVKDGSFTMPNPQLPKLDVTPAALKALRAKHAKVFDFMSKQVVPTMASLVGEQPFDPKTGQGFGCLECHTKK